MLTSCPSCSKPLGDWEAVEAWGCIGCTVRPELRTRLTRAQDALDELRAERSRKALDAYRAMVERGEPDIPAADVFFSRETRERHGAEIDKLERQRRGSRGVRRGSLE